MEERALWAGVLWRWSFVPLLYVQAALLHPVFMHSQAARLLRLAGVAPVVYSSLSLPRHFVFEPAGLRVGINLGFVGPALAGYALLSLQLACAGGPYWRVRRGDGKDGDNEGREAKGGMREDAVSPSWAEVGGFAFDVVNNPREVGWSRAPPAKVLHRPRPQPLLDFVLQNGIRFLLLHTTMVCAGMVLVPAETVFRSPQLWTYYLDGPPPEWFERISPYFVTVLFGLCGYASIALAGTLGALGAALLWTVRSCTPWKPRPFDTTEWPPLFRRPYAQTSLRSLWGRGGWHTMVRRHCVNCGYVPMRRLFLGFGSTFAQVAGLMGAFAVSAFIHEYAVVVATGWDPTFVTSAFFLGQGLGLVLELAWTRATGRRVGGPCGWLWTMFWLVWWGTPMVELWMERGIQRGIPYPRDWTLATVLTPFGTTTPAD